VAALKSRFDLAAALLLIGAVRHYGWALFPDGHKALAAKGLNAATMLCVLALVVYVWRSRLVILTAAWLAWEELQVVLCSFWFMVDPWPIKQEQPMCSARAGFDIGAIGIMFVALLAYACAIPAKSYRSQEESDHGK
jgi:hypothetical protein